MGWEENLSEEGFDFFDTDSSGPGSAGLEGWLSIVLAVWAADKERKMAAFVAELAEKEAADTKSQIVALRASSFGKNDLAKAQYLEGQLSSWEAVADKLRKVAENRATVMGALKNKVLRKVT